MDTFHTTWVAIASLATLCTEIFLGPEHFLMWIGKPLAALGFVSLATTRFFGHFAANIAAGYHFFIFIGLIAGALGDVFLIPRKNMDWFKKGVVSFFVGHLCYLIAFFLIGQSWYYTGITALGTTPFLFFYYFTVRPRVPRDMRLLIESYTYVIMLMMVFAVGATNNMPHSYLLYAAIMFVISDMFVSRQVFEPKSNRVVNALVVYPLYFAAQLLFAHSI